MQVMDGEGRLTTNFVGQLGGNGSGRGFGIQYQKERVTEWWWIFRQKDWRKDFSSEFKIWVEMEIEMIEASKVKSKRRGKR